MHKSDWTKLYKALKSGAQIQDVIYDYSRSIGDQTSVQLWLSRDLAITVQILPDKPEAQPETPDQAQRKHEAEVSHVFTKHMLVPCPDCPNQQIGA